MIPKIPLPRGLEQASRAVAYIRNHLEAEPATQIVVVAHAAGVDFLMKGAKTPKGMRERSLRREQFLPEVRFVPSGVTEVARLQHRENYAYLRP